MSNFFAWGHNNCDAVTVTPKCRVKKPRNTHVILSKAHPYDAHRRKQGTRKLADFSYF